MKKVWTKVTASALALVMTFGNISMTEAGWKGNSAQIFRKEIMAAEKTNTLDWNINGNYSESEGAIHCNSIGKGDSFLLSSTKGKDFVYEADVSFKERKGAASLILRSNGLTEGKDRKMYVANINGESGEARLFKFEDDRSVDVFQPQKVKLTDDNTYHLKITAIGKHMAYYINDKLVINTADYTMGDDASDNAAAVLGGQNDALTEGQFGLLTWDANVVYKNVTFSSITEENTPQLSGLKAEAKGGNIENPIAFDKHQYVYVTYASNATKSVSLVPEKVNQDTEITATNEEGKKVDLKNIPLTKDKQVYTLTAKNQGAEVVYRVRVHKMKPDAEYYNEDYRGQYHYSVKDGWGNDPNGMVYYNGKYHLFYQYYDKAVWGPMHWMHATSKDLIHWEEDTIQFYPDEYGTMYSGCAVIADHETAPDIFKEGEKGIVFLVTADGGSEGQKIIGAYSKDGKTFHKYEDGKVLMHWKEDSLNNSAFRDPKVFRYENQWFMVVAGGPLRIYSSKDLVNWKEESVYKDLNTECPELYPLEVTDEKGQKNGQYKWVLNRGGRKYKIGDFKQVDGRWSFVPDEQYKSTNANGMGNEENDGIMNFGPDSYAAMTYYISDFGTKDNMKLPDLIEINWMNTWEQNFCKLIPYANGNDVFNGTYNLQCKLGVRKESDGTYYLTQTPIEEYKELRDTEHKVSKQGVVTEENNLLKDFDGDSYEIVAKITPGEDVTETGFKVRTGDGQETVVKYDMEQKKFILDRSKSGTLIVNGDINVRGQKVEKNADGSLDFHIYVDRSSVELFSKNDTVAGAMQIFPSIASRGLEVYSKGGESQADITVYPLKTIWKDKQPAQAGIRLNQSKYEGYVGDQFQLKADTVPVGVDAQVVYSVKGDAVKLAQNGKCALVTAVKKGTAEITAALKDHPEIKKTCTVTIRENQFKTNLTQFHATAGKWYIDGDTYYGSHNDNGFLFADKVKTDKFTYEINTKYTSGIANFILRANTQDVWQGCLAVQLNGQKVRLFDFKGDKTFAEVNDLEKPSDNKYHLEIAVNKTKIKVSVNGKEYLNTEVPTMYEEGYVGLGLWNASAQYQNFYIVTDLPVTKIITKVEDLNPAINSSLEELEKLLPKKVTVAAEDFEKKDPAAIAWDFSKVDVNKPGIYTVTGTVGTAKTTVSVTIRSNKALEALTKEEYNGKDYTADSYKVYEAALKKAKEVLKNQNASQKEIDSAAEALTKAVNGLKKPTPYVTITAPSSVYKGQKVQLKAYGKHVSGAVKWSVSSGKYASVDARGVLYAKAAGKVVVTVQIGSAKKSVTITIKNPYVKVTAPKTVYVGRSVRLKAKGYGISGSVKWSVSKKSVASVSKAGTLKGKKAGTVYVTAKIRNYSVRVKIKVKKPYIKVTSYKKKVSRKKVYRFKAKAYGTGKSVKWSLSKRSKKYASISQNGRLKTKKKKANLTVYVKSGKVTKKLKVKIR